MKDLHFDLAACTKFHPLISRSCAVKHLIHLMCHMMHRMWSLLLLTLPTRPTAVRVRTWRTIKALGCHALRDGAYLLPQAQARAFDAVVLDVSQHGGTAHVLRVEAQSTSQQQSFVAAFDRGEAYAVWRQSLGLAHQQLATLDESAARRLGRHLADGLAGITRIDHLPGEAAEQAARLLGGFMAAIEAQFSPDEPHQAKGRTVPKLDRKDFIGKRWATRARPWVDRLACAWLIRRHIDAQAQFVWINPAPAKASSQAPAHARARAPIRTPKGCIGYDFDGARFTHVGAQVTFEVMVDAFGLGHTQAMQAMAHLVHHLDVGGASLAQSAGVEAVLMGLKTLHADDDALLEAALPVLDALHALAQQASPPAKRSRPRTR